MTQLLIALFGLTALTLAMGNNDEGRRWAPVIGLIGQPFWFMATIPTEQWGMVALCVAYTLVYVRGCWANFRVVWK